MKKTTIFSLAAAALFSLPVYAQVKVAQLDGISGPFANVGEQQRKTLLAMFDEVNAKGGLNGQNWNWSPSMAKVVHRIH